MLDIDSSTVATTLTWIPPNKSSIILAANSFFHTDQNDATNGLV